MLAAIAGARPGDRNQATFAVNLDRGGTAGQITVIPKQAATTQATQDLGESLVRASSAFARRTHTEVAVGGPAGALADFHSESADRILPVIIGVAVVVALVLMVLLRAVVLPAVAVALDLLTTGATSGRCGCSSAVRSGPRRPRLHRPGLDHLHLRGRVRHHRRLRGRPAAAHP